MTVLMRWRAESSNSRPWPKPCRWTCSSASQRPFQPLLKAGTLTGQRLTDSLAPAPVAQYPAAIPILIGRIVDDVPTLAIYETLAAILVEAGVPGSQRVGIIAMLDALVFGSAIDAGSPEPLWDTNEDGQPHLHQAVASSSTPDLVASGLAMGIEASVAYI